MDIFLHQGCYQTQSDNIYKSTQFYKIWIKQDGESILIKKQGDSNGESKRKYKDINDFFNHWGLVQKDCNLIKLNK